MKIQTLLYLLIAIPFLAQADTESLKIKAAESIDSQ